MNGNIMSLLRNGTTGLGLEMEKLAYKYTTVLDGGVQKPSNRLFYVDETGANKSTNTGDIKDMSAVNYGYDKIGEMTSDVSEGIASIEWYRGGKKVKKITRSASNLGADEVEFRYNQLLKDLLKEEIKSV